MLRCQSKTIWTLGIAVFALCACLGYLLGAKPAPRAYVTLDFYGFDVEGNPIAAQDEHGTRLNSLATYELFRAVEHEETLIFTPDARDRYQVRQEKVKWLAKEEYLRWLDGKQAELIIRAPNRREYWQRLFHSYRASADRAGKNKFDYPIIFERQSVTKQRRLD